MAIYQKMLRIWWSDPCHEKVYVTDWLPEDEAIKLYHLYYKSDEKESDDYGQGYCEGYWKSYSFDERFEELEPTTAHWIEGKYRDDDIRYNDSSYKCDKCGRIVDFKENFCPDCGMKMQEVER
jgi:hypothetical protein